MSSLANRLASPSLPSTWRNGRGATLVSNTRLTGTNPVTALDDPRVFGDRLARCMAEFVQVVGGPRRPLQAGDLARMVNVDVQTVWSWQKGGGIRGWHLVKLLAFMPATFANMLLAGTGCTVAKLADARRRLDDAQREHDAAMRVAAAQAEADNAALGVIEATSRVQDERDGISQAGENSQGHGPSRAGVEPVLAAGAQHTDGTPSR